MAKWIVPDFGSRIMIIDGFYRTVIDGTPIDNYRDNDTVNVTPIGHARRRTGHGHNELTPALRAELEASVQRHPAGRKAPRCTECDHTVKAHTEAAGGCAYCDCQERG